MKFINAMLVACALGTLPRANAQSEGKESTFGWRLNVGDSFTWEFSGMDFYQSITPAEPGMLPGIAIEGFFDTDTVFNVKVFEGGLNEAPIYDVNPGFVIETPAVRSGYLQIQSGGWDDLQGAFRLTVLSGSVDLRRLEAFASVNSEEQNTTTIYRSTAMAIPEPGTLSLLGLGLILLLRRRCLW